MAMSLGGTQKCELCIVFIQPVNDYVTMIKKTENQSTKKPTKVPNCLLKTKPEISLVSNVHYFTFISNF